MNFEAISQFLDRLTFGQASWLFPVVFGLHVAEEAPRFTSWVRKYASPKFSQADFMRNNLMGFVIGVVLCSIAWFFPNRTTVFLLFVFGLNQSLLNGLFHIGTTAAYRVYSPGLITSVTLYPALFYYLSRLAYRKSLMSARAGVAALALAAVIHSIVVAQQVYFINSRRDGWAWLTRLFTKQHNHEENLRMSCRAAVPCSIKISPRTDTAHGGSRAGVSSIRRG